MSMPQARSETARTEIRAFPQRTSGTPMTMRDAQSRSLLERRFGLKCVLTGLLLVGTERLTRIKDAKGHEVALQLSLHLGVELVKVQPPFAGDLDGDDLRSHLAWLGWVVQVDVRRVDLPVALERVFVGEGLVLIGFEN